MANLADDDRHWFRIFVASLVLVLAAIGVAVVHSTREEQKREVFLDTFCNGVLNNMHTAMDTVRFLNMRPECLK